MLSTVLTKEWGLHYPIIGAPMAGVAGGALAAAVTRAGGLGMIGVGSQATAEFVLQEAAMAAEAGSFGIGLMVWALAERPDLFEAAVRARPHLLSLSFGDPSPYVSRCRASGIRVATQVHSREEAIAAERAGVDLIVVQGNEAGGHTGAVATLPLLQIVLDAVGVPVVVAGGIAAPTGVAAVLAAGAAGVWIGTALLVSTESRHSTEARKRIMDARETGTVWTHLYDDIQGLAWPQEYAGRALTNAFTGRWDGQATQHTPGSRAAEAFRAARGDYDTDYIYAGQAVGLVDREASAADVVRLLGDGAEAILRERLTTLLAGT